MRTEVTMPRLGQGMEDGVILSWRANVGDVVKRGEPLLEIESDKATVEIEAFATGRLAEIVVPAGGKALIGAVLGYIEAESTSAAPNTDLVGTRNGVSVDQTADVAADMPLHVPTAVSTPVSATPAARMSPLARRMAANHGLDPNAVQGSGPGGRILKGDVAAHMTANVSASTPATEGITPSPIGGGLGRGRLDVSPVARRLADEYGVDLYTLVGSAPNGRIIRRDVEAARVALPTLTQEEFEADEAGLVPTPILEDDASVEIRANGQAQEHRLPLSRLRRIAAGRMVESKTIIPHFYLTMDVDMAQPLRLRESLKRRGRAVSINDLVLKAAALALAEYPSLNATVDGSDLILHPHVNMAVAVAVGTKEHPEGLITPVIHECERLSLTEMSEAAAALAGRAREGKLRPDDLAGATFTVSNLGMFGIRQFEAIINPPQVAILAVGAMQTIPVFDEQDRVVRAQRLTVTLSADHRATDGAEAAGFLQAFKTALEDGFMLAE